MIQSRNYVLVNINLWIFQWMNYVHIINSAIKIFSPKENKSTLTIIKNFRK